MEDLSNDHEDHPNQHKNSHRLAIWWNQTSCFKFDGTSMETETPTWSKFASGGKTIVEQILTLEW